MLSSCTSAVFSLLLSCCFPKCLLSDWFILVFQPNYASFACALPSSPLGISSTSLICFIYRVITEEQTSCAHKTVTYLVSFGPLNEFSLISLYHREVYCTLQETSSCTSFVKPFDSKLNVCTLSSELKST